MQRNFAKRTRVFAEKRTYASGKLDLVAGPATRSKRLRFGLLELYKSSNEGDFYRHFIGPQPPPISIGAK